MKYKNFHIIDDGKNDGLFKLKVGGDKSKLINDETATRKVRVVSNTAGNNSVNSYILNNDIGIKNCITIATRGNDYLACYQDDYTITIVRALLLYTNKFELNKYIAFYICSLLRMNKYKCAYGRVLSGERIKSEKISLPIDDNEKPDWKFMEAKVKEIYHEVSKSIATDSVSPNKFKLSPKTWKEFYVGKLFEIKPTKCTITTEELTEGNDIPYIAAKKETNGFEMMCDRGSSEEFISKGNCIAFIQSGAGSAGYALYQEKEFIGLKGITSCGYHKNLNHYNALFIVAVLDQERPKYSFGRSWSGDRLTSTKIKLPAKKNSNNEYEPDWQLMEDYIKSLPYSSNL